MKKNIRKLFYLLPVNLRYILRRIIYFPSDLTRKRNELEPPRGMIFTGHGDYLKVGNQFFEYFVKYGKLTPDDSILDIGSGIGRMAVPFTNYLSSKGRFEGFDIVKKGVDWCNQNISKKFPNFNFKHIPLKNDLYNLDTNNVASDLEFPYQNESFDFAFLTSVFTHMLPSDLENYVKEIQRVLKKDKICFATFFILDEESTKVMNEKGLKNFPFDMGNYSLMDKSVKEANVGYNKEYIFELFEKNGLEITHFFRGNWSGIASSNELNEHQDIIIVKKK